MFDELTGRRRRWCDKEEGRRQRQRLHEGLQAVSRASGAHGRERAAPTRGRQEGVGHHQGEATLRPQEQAVRHLRQGPLQSHRRRNLPYIQHDEVFEKSFLGLN